MSTKINKITREIIEEAEKEAASIIKEAQKQKKDFIENKKDEAIQAAQEELDRLIRRREEAKLERERIIADAKLKADWKILEEKQKILDDIIDDLKKEIKEYTKTNRYYELLKELIVTAGSVLQGGNLILVLNQKDSSKINTEEISDKITSETETETNLTISNEKHEDYGAIIKTQDNKIIVDNRLSSILERMEKELRQKAATIVLANH
jgi:vacuolar-type H+-ATPase subunit E/Vma4